MSLMNTPPAVSLPARYFSLPVSRRGDVRDRKSTRLNSSHLVISYAVFCLKKKNDTQDRGPCVKGPEYVWKWRALARWLSLPNTALRQMSGARHRKRGRHQYGHPRRFVVRT